MKNQLIYISIFSLFGTAFSQTDSTLNVNLNEVNVAEESNREKKFNTGIKDGILFSGKKNEEINLANSGSNTATNNSREVFGKVPGLSVWENDGSGVQICIAARGLSPNRSWEFNNRQNGYDISSDVFGYPEAYYNPAMIAVERIQVIRGAAALQFGPQFGGVVNYIMKSADKTKPFAIESQQIVGSNNMLGTYTAVGGTASKFDYYVAYHQRKGDGWRQNSRFNTKHGYVNVNWQPTKFLKVGIEYTSMYLLGQQPGGLTDVQFATNHQLSSRSRNWMNILWNIPVFNTEIKLSERTKITGKVYGLISERNSVGFNKAINIKDTIGSNLKYGSRSVDRDYYNNIGTEWRFLTSFELGKFQNALAAGVRYFNGQTKRKQSGTGDAGTDFNINLASGTFGKAYDFSTVNMAAFAEYSVKYGIVSLTPGIRAESIETGSSGYLSVNPDGSTNKYTPQKSNRFVLLYGVGAEAQVTKHTNVYANYSTAFRPVTFSELTPSATTDIIDPNLKDASGYNVDLGYRGAFGRFVNFDVSAFYMHYDNRIATIAQIDPSNGTAYNFRTNVGASVSQGAEMYLDFCPMNIRKTPSKIGYLCLWGSLSFIDAKYDTYKTYKYNTSTGQLDETNLKGKRVENAPGYIHRFGLNYSYKGFMLTWQMSMVDKVFADATNTVAANSAATIGEIPSYQVQDASVSYTYKKVYSVKLNLNNITNEKYFTRRAGGYPGPGILPGDGRTWCVTLGVKL